MTNCHLKLLFICTETLSLPDVSPSFHGPRARTSEGAPETQETSEENCQVCAQHYRTHTLVMWFCSELYTVVMVTLTVRNYGRSVCLLACHISKDERSSYN